MLICHYFTKKGGGSNFQPLVTINVVIIRLRREGVWCNLALVTNFPVFFLTLPLLASGWSSLTQIKITATAVYHRAESQNLSIRSSLPLKVVFRCRLSSVEARLLSKVVFCWRSSSVEGRLLSKAVFHQRMSSVRGCVCQRLVVFGQRSSSINGNLPTVIIFHQWSSSVQDQLPLRLAFIKGHLPLMINVRQRSSSLKGCFPLKVVFRQTSSSAKGRLQSSSGTRCALHCFNTNGYSQSLSRS